MTYVHRTTMIELLQLTVVAIVRLAARERSHYETTRGRLCIDIRLTYAQSATIAPTS